MDQFIVIVAVVLYLVARVLSGVRRGGEERGTEEGAQRAPEVPRPRESGRAGVREVQQAALEALQRWEERQRRPMEPSAPSGAPPPVSTRELPDAFAAVRGPAGEPSELPAPARPGSGATRPAKPRTRPARAGGAPAAGLGRLERLPPLQKAIVLSDVVGPPLALKEEGSGTRW